MLCFTPELGECVPFRRVRFAMNKNPGRVQSRSEVPESLHAAVELRVEGMTYSIQNCSELLRRVDATGAPLLRDLDVAVASSYTSSLFQKDSSERNAANLNRIEQWRTWFVTNCVPAEDAISNVRNLSLSGYIYSGSDSECSTYDLVRPLLRRMPRLSRLDLFIGSLLDLPRPEVDFQSALPVFNELEELTIAQSSLGFLQDRLEKMGSRLKMLDIIGNLQPGPRDGPDTVDGHEDPDDRASVGSSSRADTNASYL